MGVGGEPFFGGVLWVTWEQEAGALLSRQNSDGASLCPLPRISRLSPASVRPLLRCHLHLSTGFLAPVPLHFIIMVMATDLLSLFHLPCLPSGLHTSRPELACLVSPCAPAPGTAWVLHKHLLMCGNETAPS